MKIPRVARPVFRPAVTPGHFETIGNPLRRGRVLDSHDVAGTPETILISKSLAKRKFPDQDPIGERVHVGGQIGTTYTIVGVAGDVKHVAGHERTRCGVHYNHAVALDRRHAVAGGQGTW